MFEVVGGQPFFDALVERFYERVERDAVLRPVYPDDLGPGMRALALFLGQYWGGPTTYSDEKGHPRLRMRHAPFVISERERDAWLTAMLAVRRRVRRAGGGPRDDARLLHDRVDGDDQSAPDRGG